MKFNEAKLEFDSAIAYALCFRTTVATANDFKIAAHFAEVTLIRFVDTYRRPCSQSRLSGNNINKQVY